MDLLKKASRILEQEIRGKEMEETKAITRFSMKFWTDGEQVKKIDLDIYYLSINLFLSTLLLKTH